METAIVVALGVVVAVLALLVVGLLRSHAEILRALHELGIGEDGSSHEHGAGGARSRSTSPSFQVRPGVSLPRGEAASNEADDRVGVDPNGDHTSVAIAGVARPTLNVFLSSGCLTCQDSWEAYSAPASLALRAAGRSSERRVGKEWV